MKDLSLLSALERERIRCVISDVDDTITTCGELHPAALDAMYRLKASGRSLILLTGGSAGWADIYARQWPVDLVIAESGALCIRKREKGGTEYAFHPDTENKENRKKRQQLLDKIDPSFLSSDQYCRIWDIAVDLAATEESVTERIKMEAERMGAVSSRSSIHLNIWFGSYTKLTGLQHFYPECSSANCAYIGDSLGDQLLFGSFPLSFGVNAVKRNQAAFAWLPGYVSCRDGGEGFCEIIDKIIG